MSVYCITSLIKFPVILHKLLYKRVCVLGKQNFWGTVANTVCGLFPWDANIHYFCGSPSCHEIFHTLYSSVYTCSNLDRQCFVMALFRNLHAIDNVLDTQGPISQAVLHMMLDSAVIEWSSLINTTKGVWPDIMRCVGSQDISATVLLFGVCIIIILLISNCIITSDFIVLPPCTV